jgi:hypothetical protein
MPDFTDIATDRRMDRIADRQAKPLDAVIHMLSDARGVYIPRDFIEMVHTAPIEGEPDTLYWQGIASDDAEILKNPDHEWYWEAWDSVLSKAFLIDHEGNKYTLWQDGDLWAYCIEKMTDEEKHNFGFDTDY